MTIIELGDGKQVVLTGGYLRICAHRGSLGVQLTPAQRKELGIALYQDGRRAERQTIK